MRLSDLNPGWGGDVHGANLLSFDCPLSRKHRIEIPVWTKPAGNDPSGRFVWHFEGQWPDRITVTPSVNERHERLDGEPPIQCWHGFITNGEIK